MAYGLYSATYGLSFANADVLITEQSTGIPATILESPTGGVLNTLGQAKLDSNGNLGVYIDLDITWRIDVFDGVALSNQPQLMPARFIEPNEVTTITAVPGTQYILNRVPYTRFIGRQDGTLTQLAGATGNIDSIVYDQAKRVTSFRLSGSPYLITYPTSTEIVVAGDSIATTIILDSEGYIQSVSRSFY